MSGPNLITILTGGGEGYDKPFLKLGNVQHLDPHELDNEDVNGLQSLIAYSDLVVFTGGADVSPEFYGEQRDSTTQCNPARDMAEARAYQLCVKHSIPMVGICRGAQFLTVMNGGKLIQDISGHAIRDTHMTKVFEKGRKDGKATSTTSLIQLSSTHHQMMYPWNIKVTEWEMVAYADSLSGWYGGSPQCEEKLQIYGKKQSKHFMEVEIVWYKDTRCLATQYHPEIMPESSEGYKLYQRLLTHYFDL